MKSFSEWREDVEQHLITRHGALIDPLWDLLELYEEYHTPKEACEYLLYGLRAEVADEL